MTRVKFVIFQDEQFNHWNTKTCMCYAQVGQHSEISKSRIRCKAAIKDQYSDPNRQVNRVRGGVMMRYILLR